MGRARERSYAGSVSNQKKFFNVTFSPPVSGDPKSAGSYNLTGDPCRPYPYNDPCKDRQTWFRMENDLSRKFWTMRSVTDKEILEANLQMMPGFRLSWYYTGISFKPDPLLDFPIWKNSHEHSKFNKDFIREGIKSFTTI